MLYLPLDKIMQQVTAVPPAGDATAGATPAANASGTNNGANAGAVDTRSRDLTRSRDRDPR
jgi:hypothetical protein